MTDRYIPPADTVEALEVTSRDCARVTFIGGPLHGDIAEVGRGVTIVHGVAVVTADGLHRNDGSRTGRFTTIGYLVDHAAQTATFIEPPVPAVRHLPWWERAGTAVLRALRGQQ